MKLLRDNLEYWELKSGFYEKQSELWIKPIYNQEVKHKETLKEERELIDEFNKREIKKKELISHLKALKEQVNNRKEVKEDGTALSRMNGLYHCPECPYKTKETFTLNHHISAAHRKIKSFQCSDCDKGLYNY